MEDKIIHEQPVINDELEKRCLARFGKPFSDNVRTRMRKLQNYFPVDRIFNAILFLNAQFDGDAPGVLVQKCLVEASKSDVLADLFNSYILKRLKEEETQMEDNAKIQTTVPPVTTADIEDIGERAEALVKIFGASKLDALFAVTQLKAQELNRDLTPLLELLAK